MSFRLPRALHARLIELAEEAELTPSEHARALLVGCLQDEERLRVLQETTALREEVRMLRGDVATSLEMVLLNVTKASDPDEVRRWVSENLRR